MLCSYKPTGDDHESWNGVVHTKLKYTFEIMELEDHSIAVPVGEGVENFRSVIKLNDSAAEIFNLLKEDTTESEVVMALKKHYGDESEISSYVHEFVTQLREEGVLE